MPYKSFNCIVYISVVTQCRTSFQLYSYLKYVYFSDKCPFKLLVQIRHIMITSV
uniref:Uncharacterized protein n=1 Tax=Anguilla anguilla TaxID=7936 RepID=A0A0E9QXT8_ANGAN